MLVGLLTEEQHLELEGKFIQPAWEFNPIQDGNTPPNWVISTIEMEASIYPENEWVKTLPLIEWFPPQPEPDLEQE